MVDFFVDEQFGDYVDCMVVGCYYFVGDYVYQVDVVVVVYECEVCVDECVVECVCGIGIDWLYVG